MFLRMVYDDTLAEAAYLIGCQRTGEAIVIDPERDVDRYEKIAAANGLRIVAEAETHIHADFIWGGREVAENGAKVYVSDEGDVDWKYQWLDKKMGGGEYNYRLLKYGNTFMVGNIEFKAVHTPGHNSTTGLLKYLSMLGDQTGPSGVALHVDWNIISVFIALGIAGSLIGNALAGRINQNARKRILAVFLVVMAGYILVRQDPRVMPGVFGPAAPVAPGASSHVGPDREP